MNNSLCGDAYVRERSRRRFVFRRAIRGFRRGLAPLRPTVLLAGALMLVAPLAVFAQGIAVAPRVTDRMDLTRLTTLTGNTHALAQAQYDQGAAPPDLPMNRMLLVLKRSTEQESALQVLLTQQQITSSSTFHKWLTPDQFGQQFGPADADIQAVTSWLASFGFQSISVSKGRSVIEFSGTAAQVEAGLHTSIHKYVVNGESHWANSSDPQIPTALAPVIAGVVSLHNFRPKPTMVRSGRNVTATVTPGAKPQIDLSGGTHALVPADFNTIYNVPAMTGSGVTIGIIAISNINVQDVADFRALWGLPVKNPTVILNGPDPGDVSGSGPEGEAVLDATWAGAIAPAANIDLVVSEDTNAAEGTDLSEIYIIDNNLADVMTESFSSCESQYAAAGILTGANGAAAFYSGVAEQAAAQGITFAVSSGDGGPDTCDDPNTVPSTDTAASVNLLASTPFNVAVGGTQFNDIANPSTYWSATNNSTTGGSALSYIPENTWNESCTALSPACAIVGLWSSGGGASIAFTTPPPWQAGVTGLPGTHPRLLPDVALTAADHDGYVLCIDGSCEQNPKEFAIASGTSASVQTFGAIMALLVQKMGGRVGLPNYTLYKLAAAETYASCNGSTVPSPASLSTCVFNDVTVGNTNIPPGETGFTAGVGYDETTGLGSVNVTNLLNKWNTAVVSGSATTLTLNSGAAVNVAHGTLVHVGITVSAVAPATGTPTGDVSLLANSATDLGVDFFTLNGGSVISSTNGTILLPGGNYQVHAHYGGDGTFLGSDSTPAITVNVTPEASLISIGIVVINPQTGACSIPSTVIYGSAYVLTGVVTDSRVNDSTPCTPEETGSSPTGIVTLLDSFNGGTAAALDGGTFKLNSLGYFEDQTIQLAAGTHAITASYPGDNSFSKPSFAATDIVTVGKAATTATVAASQTTVPPNTSVTLTATVATQSNATANASQEPTGTVQFFVNGTALGSPVTVTGGVNSSTLFAQATASTNTSTLAGGANAITTQYLGDSNYAASAVSGSLTVTVTSPTVTTSSLPAGVVNVVYPSTQLTASGGAAPYTWSVTAGSLPTGFAPLATTGVLSGTPTAVGAFHFTVQVKDSLGNISTAALTITVDAALQIGSTSVPTDVDAGVAYSTTLTATGGVTPYTAWTVISGSLPAGLTLSNAGVISGTPTGAAVGTANFTVKVTDSQGNTASSSQLTIAVSGFNFAGSSLTAIIISSPGMSGTGLLTLNVVNGFAGTATLAASVTASPAGAIDAPALTFTTPDSNFSTSNNMMTFSSSATTGTVTVNVASTAAAATFRLPTSPQGRVWSLTAVAVSLAGFFLFFAIEKRRRWGLVPLVILLVVVVGAGVSCGGSSSGGGGGGNTGTTLGTYTITVSATPTPGGSQAVQTAVISVTVN